MNAPSIGAGKLTDDGVLEQIAKGDASDWVRESAIRQLVRRMALQEYIQAAGLTAGPLFRPRTGSRSQALAPRAIGVRAMYNLVRRYLERLPRVLRPVAEGSTVQRCLYTPHSLRATTATLLLKAGVALLEVQDLLGHRHVTTTQIYDKRVRQTRDAASHKIPF